MRNELNEIAASDDAAAEMEIAAVVACSEEEIEKIENASLIEYYNSIVPNKDELTLRDELVHQIELVAMLNNKCANCVRYGSLASGLILRESNINVSVMTNTPDEYQDEEDLLKKMMYIMRKNDMFSELQIEDVRNKYTLCGVYEAVTFEVTINNFTVPRASTFFSFVVRDNIKVKQLIILAKKFSKIHELNGSSLEISYLVVFFLQQKHHIPCLLDIKLPVYAPKIDEELGRFETTVRTPIPFGIGRLLTDFFCFYDELDLAKNAISVRENRLILKTNLGLDSAQKYVIIVDPFGYHYKTVDSGTRINARGLKVAFGRAVQILKEGKGKG